MQMAGLRMPLESVPLQALVSEPVKPCFPCVVMSNTIHAYISQSDKGELVIGAGSDQYISYAQRGSFQVIEHTLEAICELFPIFRRMRMLRQWAGIVDITADRSPIIGKTPLQGLYVNCGWGTGRLQGHAGLGPCLRPHHRHRRAAPDRGPLQPRPLHHRPPDRRGGGSGGGALDDAPDRLPPLRPAARDRVPLRRRGAHLRRPDPATADDAVWAEYLFIRKNPKGLCFERWRHVQGCGRWFNAARDTRPRPLPRRLSSTGDSRRKGCRERSLQAGAGWADRSGAGPVVPLRRPDLPGCHAGDTLASALLANGVHLVGRSFKYHRPRGIVTAGAEEPNALVQLVRPGGRSDPNTRATEIELYEGLEAWSQNRWPSLRADVGAAADALSPLIPAGFYYKTFLGSSRRWHRLYEPRIRSAAGLGPAPTRSGSRLLPASARPLRRAGGRRRARRPHGSARGRTCGSPGDPGRGSGRARRLAAQRERGGGTGRGRRGLDRTSPGRAALPARGDGAQPHHGLRLL